MEQTIPFQFHLRLDIPLEFPAIPLQIIESIADNTFRPTDLDQLIPPTGRCDFQSQQSEMSEQHPTHDSLLQALLIYFSILSALAEATVDIKLIRAVRSGAFSYVGRLLDYASSHPWEETRRVHFRFHEERCLEMARGDFSGWAVNQTFNFEEVCHNESTATHPIQGQPLQAKLKSFWQTSLPPEILHLIFQRTVIPEFLLDSSCTSDPSSAWCQNLSTQKSLALVCRSWNTCAVEYLYQNVSIRRMPQMSSFLDALGTSLQAVSLRYLIKTFAVWCFVEREDVQLFENQVAQVILLCTNLARFTFGSPFPSLPITSALRHLRPSVTELCLVSPISIHYADLHQILRQVSPHLTFLHIDEFKIYHSQPVTSAFFPCLEKVIFHIQKASLRYQLDVITQSWSMPKLNSLTICLADFQGLGSPAEDHKGAILPFFIKHGARLTFLHLPAYLARAIKEMGWKSILGGLCPRLERLCVDEGLIGLDPSEGILSSSLKWLDLTGHELGPTPRALEEIKERANTRSDQLEQYKQSFPQLVRIRRLWWTPIHLSEWLQGNPPDLVNEQTDRLEIQMYQGRFVSDVGEVYLELMRDGYDTESDDGSYEPSEHSSNPTSDSSSYVEETDSEFWESISSSEAVVLRSQLNS